MVITSVSVKKIERENSKLRGFASAVLDDAIVIHDIRIIEGENGLWIQFPSRKIAEGEYKDTVHPINAETRTMFEQQIIEAYNQAE